MKKDFFQTAFRFPVMFHKGMLKVGMMAKSGLQEDGTQYEQSQNICHHGQVAGLTCLHENSPLKGLGI